MDVQYFSLDISKEAITLITEITKIRGISPELLHRYVEMRRKIDVEANTIYR